MMRQVLILEALGYDVPQSKHLSSRPYGEDRSAIHDDAMARRQKTSSA